MKVEYTKRAVADLRKVSADSRAFGEAVAASVEARISEIIAHIAEHPEAAARVVENQAYASYRSFATPIESFTGFSKTA